MTGSSSSNPGGFCSRLSRWTASPWFWGILLAFGVAVRLRQYFACLSYWYDEAFFVLVIREHGMSQLLGPQPYALVIPPVYLWITRWLYELGGQGELVLRIPAIVAAVAGLCMMIPLAKRIAGPKYGVWAFALLAVCRHAIIHGSEVRPYTTDMLFTELILYFTAVLLQVESTVREKKWAHVAMLLLAAIGPWTSFPCVFILAASSLALAFQQWGAPQPRGWAWWVLLNGLVGISAIALWWFSGRYMYYPGMIEHWKVGWGGFPEWSSFSKTCSWALSRPFEIASYGTRELGAVVILLSILGAIRLVRRSGAMLILLALPFFVTLTAALLGKYPMAGRTTFFLLPCFWLLAAFGIQSIAEWCEQRGRKLEGFAVLLIVWDFIWLVIWLVHPDPAIDYRGGFEYMNARRQPGDKVWTSPSVTYETYHGKDPALFEDKYTYPQAIQMTEGRLWLFTGKGWVSAAQAPGRAILLKQQFGGGELVLLGPKTPTMP